MKPRYRFILGDSPRKYDLIKLPDYKEYGLLIAITYNRIEFYYYIMMPCGNIVKSSFIKRSLEKPLEGGIILRKI